METTTSAPNALHDHPTGDTEMMDPTRPSEDPGDAAGDDECRPDAPTGPPDQPLDEEVEGARVEGSEVETAMVGESGGVEEDLGKVGDNENRPGKFEEPPNEPQVEFRGPTGVQVEPGGKTDVM